MRLISLAGAAALALAAPAQAAEYELEGEALLGGERIAELTGTWQDVGDPAKHQGFVLTILQRGDPGVVLRVSGTRFTSGSDPRQRFIALGRLQRGNSYDISVGRSVVDFENGAPSLVYVGGLQLGGTFVGLLGGADIRLHPPKR